MTSKSEFLFIGTTGSSDYLTDNTGDKRHWPVVDRLDDILDIAAEVVYETAPDPGTTRLERLARYVVMTLGGAPYTVDEAIEVVGRNDQVAIMDNTGVAVRDIPEDREVAVAYIRLAESVG